MSTQERQLRNKTYRLKEVDTVCIITCIEIDNELEVIKKESYTLNSQYNKELFGNDIIQLFNLIKTQWQKIQKKQQAMEAK